jgi:pimeloyl-ACP methyl ester carboxylesterase
MCALYLLALIGGCARKQEPRPSTVSGAEAGPPSLDTGTDAAVDAAPARWSETWGIAFRPPSSGAPAIVYLHGMWASPEDSCGPFERASIALSAPVICPRGNRPRASGGAFGGALSEKRRSLDDAFAALSIDRGGTLAGFSSGAAFASELAIAEPGKWTGLVLMSMKLEIRAAAWKSAGVRRVVFAAGELDGTYAAMKAAPRICEKAGLPARFVSLGKVGHHFAVDMDDRMEDAIRWLRE